MLDLAASRTCAPREVHVIGRATAPLHGIVRRVLQSRLGLPSIEVRQKWLAVWPVLAALPPNALRVLDAGCGDGTWTAELAARRPQWQLVGVDRDEAGIHHAAHNAERLGLRNVQFLATDFLTFRPTHRFDAILSVSSAHYLVEQGLGDTLFSAFADWLADGGRLVLYGPRRRADVPMMRGLPEPFSLRDVLDVGGLATLCEDAGLDIEQCLAVGRRAGTLAKQLARVGESSAAARAALYPLQLGLIGLDQAHAPATAATVRSSALLLVARRRPRVGDMPNGS